MASSCTVAVREALEEWAAAEGLTLTEETWKRLDGLVELWKRYGAAFNLVGDRGTAALVEHVREGLMAVRVVERLGGGGLWVDIGSGAGIPGLVVGVVRGNVALVEPRERRSAFLELAISHLSVREGRAFRARWGSGTFTKVGSAAPDEWLDGEIGVVSSKAVMAPESWVFEGELAAPRGVVVCHVNENVAVAVRARFSAEIAYKARVVGAFRSADAVSAEN